MTSSSPPLGNIRRNTAAGVAFLVAGLAGWWSAPTGENAGRSRAAPAVARSAPAAGAVPETAAAKSSPAAAVAARLERRLLEGLNRAESVFSGERLRELTRKEDPTALPREEEGAFQYADRWAKAAPDQLHAWFREQGISGYALPSAAGSKHLYGNQIFYRWTTKDPDAAVAAAEAEDSEASRRDSLTAVLSILRTSDPARALALTAKHAALLASGESMSSFSTGEDPAKDWDYLLALPEGEDRSRLLAGFVDGLGQHNRDGAVVLWNGLPPERRRELVEAGFEAEGFRGYSAEGERIITPLEGFDQLWRDYVAASGDPGKVESYLQNGASEWAKTDPAAAIAWVRENLTGEAQVTGAARLFQTGAQHQFDATVAAWQELPEGGLRARAAGHLAAGAPGERKAEAEALLSTLSPADQGVARKAMEYRPPANGPKG